MRRALILFFAADPTSSAVPLTLDEEVRSIEQVLQAEKFLLVSKWATRADDLLQYLNELEPTIVHFSGHGSSDGSLMLHDEGGAKLVSPDALAQLFFVLRENIRVVYINACHSTVQAEAVARHIDCVIGMPDEVDDVAARVFARSFYRALDFGESVAKAHEQGRTALLLEGFAETQTPRLVVRSGVDASQVFPLGSPASPGSDRPSPQPLRLAWKPLLAASGVLAVAVPFVAWMQCGPEHDSTATTEPASDPSVSAAVSNPPPPASEPSVSPPVSDPQPPASEPAVSPPASDPPPPTPVAAHDDAEAQPLPFCNAAGGCELAWDGPAIRTIETGGNHFCVIPTDGSLSCWGSNDHGSLGYGNRTQRRVNGGAAEIMRVEVGDYVRSVSGGESHTCVVTADNGRVRCWGSNDEGQLGLGHKDDLGDDPGELPPVNVPVGAPATAVAAGAHHTCALVEGGQVRCWGRGFEGQLCSGKIASRGDHEDEMPPPDIAGISSAIQLVAGDAHTCVLLQDGSVRCWGQSRCGQVGLTTTNQFGAQADQLEPPQVDVGGKVIQLAAGAEFTCALLEDGAVRCWGCNFRGQLGYGHTEGLGNQVGEMPPPDVEIDGRATQVVAGAAHVCVLLDTRRVRCWGEGENGELGLGPRDPLGDDPDEMPPPDLDLGSEVQLLAAHMSSFTCALLVDGKVRCWGSLP